MHGPAQVVAVESQRVIWVSHAGYLIRASPQQIRPASMREFHAITRDSGGRIAEPVINPRCRNFVADAPNVVVPESTADSQPDGEQFPPESPVDEVSSPYTPSSPVKSHGGDSGVIVDEPKEPHEIPVPDDDQDLLFGDDVELPPGESGSWEIGLCDGPEMSVDSGFETVFCDVP